MTGIGKLELHLVERPAVKALVKIVDKAECHVSPVHQRHFPGPVIVDLSEPGHHERASQRFAGKALEGERDPKPFILMARELTLLGFFSSRVGITENMEYVPVPTAYHGCVPLSQMKKHVYWE